MAHLNKLFQLLAFPLILSLLGAEATLPSQLGSFLQSRTLNGAVPAVLDVKPFLEPRNDQNHMLHALDLVRRLVNDRDSMVEVSEQDLQSLLDQINTLQAQVNGLLPIHQTSTLPDEQSTSQPGDDNGNQVNELPPSTTLPEDQPTPTEPLQSEESSSAQPEDVSDDQSVDSTDGQPDDDSNGQSEENSEDATGASSEESPQETSADPSEEIPSSVADPSTTSTVSVPGGRFKEAPKTTTHKSSGTVSSAPPTDTLLESEGPPSEEQQGDSAGATALECPIASLTVVNGTTVPVSELSPNTLNTNCAATTVSILESVATASIAPALTTSAPLTETTQTSGTTISTNSAEITEQASIPTGLTSAAVSLIASESVQDDLETTEVPPQLRTLVLTSVLMRMSTVTLTSMHTELFTVIEASAGPSSTVSETDDVDDVGEDEVENQGDAAKENIATTTSESLSNSNVQGLPTNSTASMLPAASETVSFSSTNVTLSDESTLEAEPLASTSFLGNSTVSISYLSGFTTMLKPTTSVRESTLAL